MPSMGHISVMGSPAASLYSANTSLSSFLKPRRFPKHALCVSDSLTIRECLLIISHCGCWKISQLPACSSCYPTSASWLTWPWEFWHTLYLFPVLSSQRPSLAETPPLGSRLDHFAFLTLNSLRPIQEAVFSTLDLCHLHVIFEYPLCTWACM